MTVHYARPAGRRAAGIVLKIETRQAFEQLPQLLLTAMRRPKIGVIIARGDLAVECGYERLAELQEEILWLCEAAHPPLSGQRRSSNNSPNAASPPAPRSAMRR
jgi:pyruvate kinase